MKRFKYSFRILLIVALFMGGWGLLELINPVGQVQDLAQNKEMPSPLNLLLMQCCGLYACIIAAVVICLLFIGFRSGELWAWRMISSIATAGLGGEFGLCAYYGYRADAYILATGLVICWVALLLPVRQFFKRRIAFAATITIPELIFGRISYLVHRRPA